MAGIADFPPQIHTRSPVKDIAGDVEVLVVLLVDHMGALRFHADTSIEAEFTQLIAEHDTGIVVVLVVLGILRVIKVFFQLQGIDAAQESGVELGGNGFVTQPLELVVEHILHTGIECAVAVGVTTLELVAELKVSTFEDGLGIREACPVVPVVGGIGSVLVVEGQVGLLLVVMDETAAVVVAVAARNVSSKIQRDVAAGLGQTAVNLQPTIDVIALAVAEVAAVVGVDTNGIGIVKSVVFIEGINHSGSVGVTAESNIPAVAFVVVIAVTKTGAELDIGHRVRLQFDAEVAVDIRVAAITLAEAVDVL